MNKSPEEYFQEQNFSTDMPPQVKSGEFTDAERAFMEKYMGIEAAGTLKKIGIEAPSPAAQPSEGEGSTRQIQQQKAADASRPQEEPLEDVLKRASELLLVGFFLGRQEFVVPTLAVQEVIRYSTPAKLPMAPSFIAGVINLRGKVTPLVRLRDLLGVSGERQQEDQFIIVCRRRGLQLGLMIERVHTMYRVEQKDIDWAVEAHLGSVDFISGLLKLRDELIGIVSVDTIVQTVIRR